MSEIYSFRRVIFVTVTCQVPYMEVSMLIYFKKKSSTEKSVPVYIFSLNTEMIDRLRQLYFPSTAETAGKYRKISDCHRKGYACLMGEKL